MAPNEYEAFISPEDFELYMDLRDSEGLSDVLTWMEEYNTKAAESQSGENYTSVEVIQFSDNLLNFLDAVFYDHKDISALENEPDILADEFEAEREILNDLDVSNYS